MLLGYVAVVTVVTTVLLMACASDQRRGVTAAVVVPAVVVVLYNLLPFATQGGYAPEYAALTGRVLLVMIPAVLLTLWIYCALAARMARRRGKP